MKNKPTQTVSRFELMELAQRCSDFMAQFSEWRDPAGFALKMNDVSFLTERLEEYKRLVKNAEQLKVVDLSHMPRGWWPGFEAKITDEKHLVASRATERKGEGRSAYWVKGENYDIAPESLPRFFQSAAGMLANRAHDTVRRNELTHGPLVEHISPGGPTGLTVHFV